MTLFFSITGIWLNNNNGGLKYFPKEKQKVLGSFITSDYQYIKHEQIRLLEFSKSNNKKDILIIGDSFSEDLVNAVFEAGLNNYFEFSSYYIPAKCGVLFVIDKKDREDPNEYCERQPSFYDDDIQLQMSLADEIWVVSNWEKKDAFYMAESLQNIKAINKNIKLFVTKNFGSVRSQWYRVNNIDDWPTSVFDHDDEDMYSNITNLNNDLNKIADSLNVKFIKTQQLICKGYDSCSNYVEGDIISFDGLHLTKHGAKRLGDSLKYTLIKTNSAKD